MKCLLKAKMPSHTSYSLKRGLKSIVKRDKEYRSKATLYSLSFLFDMRERHCQRSRFHLSQDAPSAAYCLTSVIRSGFVKTWLYGSNWKMHRMSGLLHCSSSLLPPHTSLM